MKSCRLEVNNDVGTDFGSMKNEIFYLKKYYGKDKDGWCNVRCQLCQRNVV